MAIIHPRISPPLALQHGGYQLELKLLEILRMGLPDNFDVFHGLTWSTVHNAMQKFGELDLTVVSPQGQVLILEVKAGSVYTQNGLLFKDYRQEKPKDIGQQLGRQHGELRKRLYVVCQRAVVTYVKCALLVQSRIAQQLQGQLRFA